MFSFSFKHPIGYNFIYSKDYSMTFPIAGSSEQIKTRMKESLDIVIEKFASDYYYMKDLK